MKFPAAIVLSFCLTTAVAQTFFSLPDAVLEKEVAFEQANECYIFFDNPSGDSLQLRWRIFSESVPQDWKIDLCDYGLCYVGIPSNGTMNPVYDTIQPYLKLIVQPGTTPGSAWLWFHVFEKDNEDNATDVYFSLFTPGTTGAGEPQKMPLQVFPNPASDVLFIENRDGEAHTARLLNAGGKQMWERPVAANEQIQVNVQAYPSGLYFLQKDNLQPQKILIQK